MTEPGARPTLDGRFELIERLPQYGYGEAWRARDLQVRNRAVVVKLLDATDDPSLDAALRRLKSFRHGAVLALLHHGVAGGRPYVVHDYFEGASLAAELARAWREDAPLPRAALERLTEKLCAAVEAAHAEVPPVVHGGLRASCVLVRLASPQQVDLRVVDFGVARFARAPDEPDGDAARAFTYPPTLATGAAGDAVALGRILRATCAAPSERGAPPAAPGLDWRRDDVPDAVWAVIRRATSHRPDERYRDVDALARALQAAWEEPTSGPAPRPTTSELVPETEAPPETEASAVVPSTSPPSFVSPVITAPPVVTSPPVASAAPTSERPEGLARARLDGRYEVGAFVAQGGCGAVYKGRHPLLKRDVAIKVLKSQEGADARARQVFFDAFLQEAQTIARLDHPAIVRVLDFGIGQLPGADDAPWMVLEWVDGKTLGDELRGRRAKGGRAPEEALALMKPVFEALGVAHVAGVVHRDIKPSNLMLPASPTSPSVRVRILDFGIAKLMEQEESVGSGETGTRGTFTAFSLLYAAPEQVSATRTGPWTDVHALALILTELLVDGPPYRGQDRVAVMAEVLAEVRPTPARFGVDVGAWEPVLAKALAVRPSERFADATEFLRALEGALPRTERAPVAPAPVAPAPVQPAVTERPRRGRGLIAAGVVGLVLVAGAAAVGLRSASTPREGGAPDASVAPVARTSPAPVAEAPPARTESTQDAVDAGAPSASATQTDAQAPAPDRAPRPARTRRRPGTLHGLPSDQI